MPLICVTWELSVTFNSVYLHVNIKYSLTVNTVYYYSMYLCKYTEVSQFSVHI